MKKNKVFVLLLLFACLGLQAQTKEVSHQNLYWLRYYNQLTLNPKWTLHNEIENRRLFENHKQHTTVIHSRAHYNLFENVNVGFGVTYSRVSLQDSDTGYTLVVPEIRPVQEINYKAVFTERFSMQHRFRVDERFTHNNDGLHLTDGYGFNFRFRYRLQASYKLGKDQTQDPFIIKAGDEVMFNAGNRIVYNTFDQNRIYLAVEKSLGNNFSAELCYIHWFQQRSSGYQYFEREILRFTIYHRLKL